MSIHPVVDETLQFGLKCWTDPKKYIAMLGFMPLARLNMQNMLALLKTCIQTSGIFYLALAFSILM